MSRVTQQLAREALTEAALALFYRQGVASTTLADIAGAAGVPIGNVYYHFRTKEALVEAVIDQRIFSPIQRVYVLSIPSQSRNWIEQLHSRPSWQTKPTATKEHVKQPGQLRSTWNRINPREPRDTFVNFCMRIRGDRK